MGNEPIVIRTIKFSTEITEKETPYLRGLLMNLVGRLNVLFHNHEGDGLRYSYPKVQYKSIGGKAAIVCIGESAGQAHCLTCMPLTHVELGKRRTTMKTESCEDSLFRLQVGNTTTEYTIKSYLPFNQKNHQEYQQSSTLLQRIGLLERCLVGNILSMAKGLDVHIDGQIEVKLTDMEQTANKEYKGVSMTCFHLSFTSNVELPEHIGLGKGVSVGYGTIEKRKEKK